MKKKNSKQTTNKQKNFFFEEFEKLKKNLRKMYKIMLIVFNIITNCIFKPIILLIYKLFPK